MASRRETLFWVATATLMVTSLLSLRPALAQSSDHATEAGELVRAASSRIIAIFCCTGSDHEKRQQLLDVINDDVDVEEIAHFCLGRFWQSASTVQQTQYLKQFRELLLIKIASSMGDYRGASVAIGAVRDSDGGEIVTTTVSRPANPPIQIEWVVRFDHSGAKIVDLISWGASLRVTQNADFSSFLSQHHNNIDELNEAMRKIISSSDLRT